MSPIEVTSLPVGVTGNTTGVYLAVTGVPFLSSRFTVTPVACPVNDFSGVNVTVPSGATVYVPSPSIVTESTGSPVFGSTNLAGLSDNSTVFSTPLTVVLPASNSGFPVCLAPCTSVVVTPSAVGVTGLTVGVYLAVTSVPFLSTRLTVTPLAFPVNCGSGVNVTTPFSSTVYVPSLGTTTLPSSSAPTNVGLTSGSRSTVTS